MMSRVQSIISIFATVVLQDIAGDLLCKGPSPVIQQIPPGVSEIEYYHNESLTNRHWCVNKQFVMTNSTPCPSIQLHGTERLIYRNPSPSDESVLIYLLTGMGNGCEDFRNDQLITIYSTLMPERSTGAKLIVTNTVEAVSCFELSPPSNGRMRVNNDTSGQTVSFSCNPGFHLNGSETLACLRDDEGIGYWNDSTPTCNSDLCDKRNLTNGSEQYFTCTEEIGVSIGSVVTYSCDPGFTLVGDTRQTCWIGPNNAVEWSGAPPYCEPNVCEKLPEPENGSITIKNATYGTVSVGTEQSYTCDPGFRLSSTETRVCMPDGNWSGQNVTCIWITCDYLNHPQNGSVTYKLIEQSLVVGSVAMYTCDEGFEVVSGNSTRVCTLNSGETAEWTGEGAMCNTTLLSSSSVTEAQIVTVTVSSTIAALIAGLVLGVLLGIVLTYHIFRFSSSNNHPLATSHTPDNGIAVENEGTESQQGEWSVESEHKM